MVRDCRRPPGNVPALDIYPALCNKREFGRACCYLGDKLDRPYNDYCSGEEQMLNKVI